ncbi:MAG TPA: acetyl-CoA C-acetyltransferase [Salinisphaeraceae bacterium]|nr:acetyl-CoA C-acetyltransferase [Salinisphaeraceae bacterium]
MPEAYIVAAGRTAGGRRGGRMAGWHPADLAGAVIDDLLQRAGAEPQQIDDVILGCVTQVGEQGMNIARNAVLSSSLPETVPGTSVDRQCGSSQQALHFAAQAVMSGSMDMVIAAGVESMSRAPMFTNIKLPQKAGLGHYMGPKIRARYPDVPEFSQFTGAEMIAEKHGFSRAELDAFALHSHERAIAATEAGRFADEIIALPSRDAEGQEGEAHTVDEGIRFDASADGIAGVEPLQENGRITAANASQLCDGAAGLVVVNERGLQALAVAPLACVHHLSVLGGDPVTMLEVPLPATAKALAKAGMTINDIDLFEVNEAFASVPMAWLKASGADPERMNVNGGAIALGHPLGATGAKLMTTLIHALRQRGGRYGLQTMCEGGGMANVTIVEAL